jgi:hypothetical protein
MSLFGRRVLWGELCRANASGKTGPATKHEGGEGCMDKADRLTAVKSKVKANKAGQFTWPLAGAAVP